MRLLVDSCLPKEVAQWLRDSGHDTARLHDDKKPVSNVDLFRRARDEERVVLTFDVDPAIMRLDLGFGEFISRDLLAGSGKGQRVSAILLRLRNTRAEFVIRRLDAVLPQCTDAMQRGAIVVVEDTRHYMPRVTRMGDMFVGSG